jgi:hypothetical protein
MTDVLFTSDDIEWMIRVPMDTNQIFEDDSRRVGNKAWETDVNVIFEEGLHLVHCYPVFFFHFSSEAQNTLDNINKWIQTFFHAKHDK